MKTAIRTMLPAVALALLVGFASCKQKKGKLEVTKDGVTIEGKKGGSVEVDKEGLRIEDRNGSKLEVDKEGVKVEGTDNEEK